MTDVGFHPARRPSLVFSISALGRPEGESKRLQITYRLITAQSTTAAFVMFRRRDRKPSPLPVRSVNDLFSIKGFQFYDGALY
jgi:hypothetical protein